MIHFVIGFRHTLKSIARPASRSPRCIPNASINFITLENVKVRPAETRVDKSSRPDKIHCNYVYSSAKLNWTLSSHQYRQRGRQFEIESQLHSQHRVHVAVYLYICITEQTLRKVRKRFFFPTEMDVFSITLVFESGWL